MLPVVTLLLLRARSRCDACNAVATLSNTYDYTQIRSQQSFYIFSYLIFCIINRLTLPDMMPLSCSVRVCFWVRPLTLLTSSLWRWPSPVLVARIYYSPETTWFTFTSAQKFKLLVLFFVTAYMSRETYNNINLHRLWYIRTLIIHSSSRSCSWRSLIIKRSFGY